jgi:hypothetical protein
VPWTWSCGKCSGIRSTAPGVVGLRSAERRASECQRVALRDVPRSSRRRISLGCGVRKVSFAEARKEQARSQGEETRIVERTKSAKPGVPQCTGDRGAWLGAAVRPIRNRAAGSTSPCKWPSGRQLLAGRMCRHPVHSSRAAGLASRAKRAGDSTCRCSDPLHAPRHESVKRAVSPGGR